MKVRYNQNRDNGEIMISGRCWRWFQPNNHRTGDCAVRSVALAENLEWAEAFDKMLDVARRLQEPPECLLANAKTGLELLNSIGHYRWEGLSAVKGKKRITVEQFCKKHKKGTFILKVAGHVVAVRDGWFYDIWDCGNKCVYGYWERLVEL